MFKCTVPQMRQVLWRSAVIEAEVFGKSRKWSHSLNLGFGMMQMIFFLSFLSCGRASFCEYRRNNIRVAQESDGKQVSNMIVVHVFGKCEKLCLNKRDYVE